MEDKKVLENKCVELQGTLEVVQGQRNDLRHQVRACACVRACVFVCTGMCA